MLSSGSTLPATSEAGRGKFVIIRMYVKFDICRLSHDLLTVRRLSLDNRDPTKYPSSLPLLYLVQGQATVTRIHDSITDTACLFFDLRPSFLGKAAVSWAVGDSFKRSVNMYLNYHDAKLHMGLWLRLVAWEYYFLVSILIFYDLCLTRTYFQDPRPEYVDKR